MDVYCTSTITLLSFGKIHTQTIALLFEQCFLFLSHETSTIFVYSLILQIPKIIKYRFILLNTTYSQLNLLVKNIVKLLMIIIYVDTLGIKTYENT